MSSIKTLRRVPRIHAKHTPIPQLFDTRWDAFKSHLPSITFGMRKTADGNPATAMERVREFFALNFPSVNASYIAELASKLKTPLIATLGIAAVAGLAYLVYKLWTNRASIQESINTFIADIKSTAPDLTQVPGWLESIKEETKAAFSSDDPSSILEKLVKIKSAVMGHQSNINGKLGSGIDLFIDLRPHTKHNGGGIKAVVYR